MSAENQGCLGFLFRLLGIGGGSQPAGKVVPYRQRQDFLSPAELSFYRVLRTAVGEGYTVCCKVGLAELFFVPRSEEWRSWQNKIDRKHVDFVICEAQSMRPVAALELDDSSHERADRRERDAFMDRVFETAGLPIIHMQARRAYSVADVQENLRLALQTRTPAQAPAAAPGAAPTCPKCGAQMVLRTSMKDGGQFWGCSSYPRCRQVLPYERT